jgi:hypothetical protein
MRSAFKQFFFSDADGNPVGGSTFGSGFAIAWQNGPLGRHAPGCVVHPGLSKCGTCVPGCTIRSPNGAFVEDIIAAAVGRLEFYQASRFNCEENKVALNHLNAALDVLDRRTKVREQRQVEGTHAP